MPRLQGPIRFERRELMMKRERDLRWLHWAYVHSFFFVVHPIDQEMIRQP
jgi:hypothetical protein